MTKPKSAGNFRYDICLNITHPTLHPSEISKTLKLKPHREWVVGEPRKTPDGDALNGVYKQTSWGFSFLITRQRRFFRSLMKLVRSLEKKREFLEELRHSGGKIGLTVYLSGDRNIGDEISFSELLSVASLGIDVGIEVFPVEEWRRD